MSEQSLVRDPAALRRFLDGCVGLPPGELEVRVLAGGLSNVTLLAGVGDRHYVLRRPPVGPSAPGAHDVGREFRILSALRTSPLPTPAVYGFCPHSDALGAPFVVSEYIDGRILHTPEDAAGIDPASARRLCEALIDTLVSLHETPIDREPFAGWLRPEAFAARRVRRWLEQWRRGAHDEDPRADVPGVEALGAVLLARAPERDEKTLVHGDYRFGNLLIGQDGRALSVLDWELCALGDTLADLGWLTALWREPGEREVSPSPTGHPGYPTRDAVIARYEARTGRDVSDIAWYQAFALWRLACIGEGIYVRYRDGAMGDAEFDVAAQRDHVVELAEAAARAVRCR